MNWLQRNKDINIRSLRHKVKKLPPPNIPPGSPKALSYSTARVPIPGTEELLSSLHLHILTNMKPSALLLPFIASLLISGSSCRKKEPANIIPQAKFVSVYARLTAATVTARPVRPDSLSSALMVDSLLALEGVNREQYNATIKWYNEDVQRWKTFFDDVVAALEDSVQKQQKP